MRPTRPLVAAWSYSLPYFPTLPLQAIVPASRIFARDICARITRYNDERSGEAPGRQCQSRQTRENLVGARDGRLLAAYHFGML